MRDSVLIYRSFYEAIKEVSKEDQATLWQAIMEYSMNDKIPELTGICAIIWTLICPNIAANNTKFKNGQKGGEFGILGGRPKNPTGVILENPTGVILETPNEDEDEEVNVNVNVNEKKILSPSDKADCVLRELNKQTGRKFKLTDPNRKHILARLKENVSWHDFVSVIQFKFLQWNNDDKMKGFIRPQTIFGNNFDGYLQEARSHTTVVTLASQVATDRPRSAEAYVPKQVRANTNEIETETDLDF